MQREMTKAENILDNVALTNLALIIVTISTIVMRESSIEKLPIVVRHAFLFLRHHAICNMGFVDESWNHAHCWVLECSTRNSFRRA